MLQRLQSNSLLYSKSNSYAGMTAKLNKSNSYARITAKQKPVNKSNSYAEMTANLCYILCNMRQNLPF